MHNILYSILGVSKSISLQLKLAKLLIDHIKLIDYSTAKNSFWGAYKSHESISTVN